MKQIGLLLLAFLAGGVSVQWLLQSRYPQHAIERLPTTSHAPAAAAVAPTTIRPLLPTRNGDSAPRTLDLAQIVTLATDFEQTVALYQLLLGKSADQVQQLMSEAANLRQTLRRDQFSASDYRAVQNILLARLAELEPQTALQKALAMGGLNRNNRLHGIFHAWARVDYPGALASAEGLDKSQQKIAARAILLSRSDLSEVVRNDLMQRLGLQLSPITDEQDLTIAWNQALRQTNSSKRVRALAQVASQWAEVDPVQAMAAASALGAEGYNRLIKQQVLQKWLNQDAARATAWLVQQPASSDKQRLLRSAFRAYAAVDISAAQAQADALPATARTQAYLGLAPKLAEADPQAAFQFIQDNMTPNLVQSTLSSVTQHLAQHSPARADAWIALLDPAQQEQAQVNVALTLARSNPVAAAARVDALTDDQSKQRAQRMLVSSWSNSDPQAAARWVNQQASAGRGNLIETLASSWGTWDYAAAAAQIQRYPDPKDRDHARLGLLRSAGDATRMQALYQQIRDPTLKKQAAKRVYRNLRRQDEVAASEFAAREQLQTAEQQQGG